MRVNVVQSFDNGLGLHRDFIILTRTLRRAGFRVSSTGHPKTGFSERLRRAFVRRALGGIPYEVNIFIENAVPRWFDYARCNVLIPNPEWMRDVTLSALDRFDLVLCKSRSAVAAFEARGLRAAYAGFTSVDRYCEAVPRSPRSFFHLAGRSAQKGTAGLLAAWSRHPDWPPLTVVQHGEDVKRVVLPNVRHVTTRLDDLELARLQNAATIHLCPSEAEGFGHYIAEAMSCGALVLTTDAPPMNELVGTDRGVLVRPCRQEPQGLGTRYFIAESDLEAAISRTLAMPEPEMQSLGAAARRWFLDNERRFGEALVRTILAL